MKRLALVVGIAQQRGAPVLDQSFERGLFKLHGVGFWAPAYVPREWTPSALADFCLGFVLFSAGGRAGLR